MDRKEAMEMAVEIVDKWSTVPVKSNGYQVDGWKSPSLSEKTEAATHLAEFLWDAVETISTGPSAAIEDDDPDA